MPTMAAILAVLLGLAWPAAAQTTRGPSPWRDPLFVGGVVAFNAGMVADQLSTRSALRSGCVEVGASGWAGTNKQIALDLAFGAGVTWAASQAYWGRPKATKVLLYALSAPFIYWAVKNTQNAHAMARMQ